MTSPAINPRSMRVSLDEIMQGILATITADEFSDNLPELATSLKGLSENALIAPMADSLNEEALGAVLGRLEERRIVRHEDGRYVLTVEGRAQCTSAKRTLFNAKDREDLETAAQVFEGR